MSAEKVATLGTRSELWECQRICDNGGEAVPTTVVYVIELACETLKQNARM